MVVSQPSTLPPAAPPVREVVSPHSRSLYRRHFGVGAIPRALFFPPDFESAKEYLKGNRRNWAQNGKLPPRYPRNIAVPLSTTLPLSSRDTEPGGKMVRCHGCHGQVGEGAHLGSATGKNRCSFRHSNDCPGGFIEDSTWQACPPDYIAGQVSGTGFEHTIPMQQSQVVDQSRGQTQPFFSTPQHPEQSFIRQPLHDQIQQMVDHQVPHGGVVSQALHSQGQEQQAVPAGSDRQQQHQGQPIAGQSQTQSVDAAVVEHSDALWSERLRVRNPINYNDDVAVDLTVTQATRAQDQVGELRARNQAAAMEMRVGQQSSQPWNINHLRADTELIEDVDGHMGVFREHIPSLCAAPTAPPIPNPTLPQAAHLGAVPKPGAQHGVYGYNVAQLRQVTGDGIRVTASDDEPGATVITQQLPRRSKPRFPSFVTGDVGHNGVQQLGQLHQPSQLGGQLSGQQQQKHHVPPTVYPRAAHQQYHVVQEGDHQQHQAGIQGVQPLRQQQYQVRQNVALQPGHPSVYRTHAHQFQPLQKQFQESQHGYSSAEPSVGNLHQQGHPLAGQQQQASHQSQHYLVQPQQQVRQLPQQILQNQPLYQPENELYEYATDITGRRILVKSSVQLGSRSPQQLQPVPGGPLIQHSPQRDPYLERSPRFKTEYRCNPNTGELYEVQVPTSPGTRNIQQPQDRTSPQFKIEFRCDPNTGQLYKVRLPISPHQVTSTQQDQLSMQSKRVAQQHKSNVTTVPWQSVQQSSQQSISNDGNQTRAQEIEDKVKGIVSFVEQGGATKKTKLIDYAKRCSAKWVTSTSVNNMNLPLYGFAAVSELEAGFTGKSEALSREELISKLSHVKSVFEVCCINSQAQDFTGYGWTLARDYAKKVESKVDQNGLQWQQVSSGVQTDMLMMAQCDYPRPAIKTNDFKEKKKGDSDKPERLCTSYNNCTTDNKCEYEVNNPGRSCQRKHECSYCRKHFKQGCRHQEVKCIKKQGGIVGSGN